MNIKFSENKLIELFIDVDDLYKSWQIYQANKRLGKSPTRVPELSESEVCTIIAAYHLSGYKCFDGAARAVLLSATH